MATWKPPAGLPEIGQVVNTSFHTYHSLPTDTPLVHIPSYPIDYRIQVQFLGTFYYIPGGGYASSPAPNLHFKYQNRIHVKRASGWVEIPPDNYPWNPKPPQQFWSAKSPMQLYGWKPLPTPTQGFNHLLGVLHPKKNSVNDVGGSSTSTNPGVSQVAFRKRPSGPLVTNPPLHRLSKGNMHFERTIADNSRLGVISLPSQIRSIQGAKYSKNWGFRFLYNPTAFGYSQTSTDGVMPEQITASRTDLLIPATSSYSIELYLNRIPDLKKANQSSGYYSPRPYAADLHQLWGRGTEYDLDFLYRVINGDPKTIVGWNKSSNIGALIMQRVLLRMGGGLHITGVINSINVQHVMFTDNMVPTFTTITLDFTQWFQEFKK